MCILKFLTAILNLNFNPRFVELKNFYGIEDEMPSVGQQALRRWPQDSCMNLRFLFLLFSFSFFSSTSFYMLKVFNCVYNMQLSLWNVWAHQLVRSCHWERNCQPLQQLYSWTFPPTTFSWICVCKFTHNLFCLF